VSTPVTWAEVRRCLRDGDPSALEFTTAEVQSRITQKGDLFAFS
jgi:DNA primase